MTLKTLRNLGEISALADVESLETFAYEDLVPAQSIYELFRATAGLHGDHPALTVLTSADANDVSVACTHQELFEDITRAANLFSALGVGDGDVIAIVSKTYGPVPSVMWGASTAGVVSCLNYMLSVEVLLELLLLEQAKVLVCPGPALDPDLWVKLSGIIDKVPSLKHVLIVGGAVPRGDYLGLEYEMACQEHRHLLAPRKITRDTLCAYFHTGGTTGSPKLVPHTHGNVIHAAWSFAQALGTTEEDCAINGMPFFHVGGTSPWALAIVAAGGHVVIPSPDGFRNPAVVQNMWNLVAHFKTTLFGAVPTTIGALENVPVGGADISSLRLVLTGGAGISGSVADRFEQMIGVPLVEQYGMTETVAAIACTPATGQRQRGSVGLRHPFSQIRVVRDPFAVPMQDCPAKDTGVVVCRGRQVVTGYANPKNNADTFNADGWLITGDVGHLTKDGQLVLTGRKKDLIIRSGHNLDPAIIEEVANLHPSVGSSAAVGMPDAYAGEVPVLFVTAKPHCAVDVAVLAAHMQQNIPEPPARPRHIFVLPALPLTGVGKVFKPALRTLAVSEKIRLELAKCDPAMQIDGVSVTAEGTVVATVDDRQAMGDLGVIRSQVAASLRDLLVKIDLKWLSQ